jgi:hypothetical protein
MSSVPLPHAADRRDLLDQTSNGPEASVRSRELKTPISVISMISQKAPADTPDSRSSFCSVVWAIRVLSRAIASSRRTPPRTATATIQPMMRITIAPRMRGRFSPSAIPSELPIPEKSMSPPPRECQKQLCLPAGLLHTITAETAPFACEQRNTAMLQGPASATGDVGMLCASQFRSVSL